MPGDARVLDLDGLQTLVDVLRERGYTVLGPTVLGVVAGLVTRMVVTPVRVAARTAQRLSAGLLDQRMKVDGEDDLALLAASFNQMAANLQRQIVRLEEMRQSTRIIEQALANYETFIKQFFPALSEREKTKYWNTIKGDFEFYNTLAFSNHC